MDKFGEQRTFTFSGIQKLFRLPATFGNGQIYVNVGNNSVIKAYDTKIIHSWNVVHPFALTSPVVFDPNDETLCSILDNQTLIKWSSHDETLKKALKIKFQESVFSLILVPGERLLILTHSCKLIQYSSSTLCTDPLSLTAWDSNEKIIWADALWNNNFQIFVLGFCKKNKTYKLHSFKVNKENDEVSLSFQQNIVHNDSILKTWCLNKFNSTFFTFWSDGTVLKYEAFKMSSIVLFSTANIQKMHLIAMDIIDESHICIARAVPKYKECLLELWDFKFSACKVNKTIKTSVSLDHLQMAVINSSILLLFNEDLVSVPFHIEKSSLASVLGVNAELSSKPVECQWNSQGELCVLAEIPESLVEKMDISNADDSNSKLKTSLDQLATKFSHEGPSYFKYLPDAELLTLLRLTLRHKMNVPSNEEKTISSADIILNAVLSSSFSDICMMKLLKKLNRDETLMILQILLAFLKNPVRENKELVEPTDFQVFNWTCLIIQSQMETLLFSKDTKTIKLLKELDNCLLNKMEEYEDFESIKNLLMLKRDVLPKNNIVKKYCIEALE